MGSSPTTATTGHGPEAGSSTLAPMSTWHREVLQMAGAAVAVVGLALIVLAAFGPLVATGVALWAAGLAAVGFGYVGLSGPPPPAAAGWSLEAEAEADLLKRARRPDPDMVA